MNAQELQKNAAALVADGKGILAVDESTGTIGKRFDSINVENTEDNRREYREMLFRTNGVGQFISGAILFDETLRQKAADGTPLAEIMQKQGIMPGIKVDKGAKPLAGALEDEKVTEGLDGLRERLKEYYELGARFAKWRAVIEIDSADRPSRQAIQANAEALARYAALCQENNLVPIVEPEVLMDGDHTLERCEEVTGIVLNTVFEALRTHNVMFEGMLLKPNMVLAGLKCAKQNTAEEVAAATLRCFNQFVPATVPGVVFLSGGQSSEDATANLNAMNAMNTEKPWKLSFSYGRALQADALKTWQGKAENASEAQKVLLHRAKLNSAAATGTYKADMEAAA